MKRFKMILTYIFYVILYSGPIHAQTPTVHVKPSYIEPYQLQISSNKTVSLVFPYSIKSVDRGSPDVLAQEARGVDNILQLKAARDKFAETNLTVITADGNLFSFLVNYDPQPARLVFSFPADTLSGISSPDMKAGASQPVAEQPSETSLIRTAEALLKSSERTLHGINDKHYKVKLSLCGISIQQDVMYYELRCANSSNIDYDVEGLRFYLRDQKRSKRTASQEIEIKPLYIAGNSNRVEGKSKTRFVVALSKFTLPDAKYLAIELKEKNGGRNLLLKVHNRHIVRAAVVKPL